jgi:hypothetical protein
MATISLLMSQIRSWQERDKEVRFGAHSDSNRTLRHAEKCQKLTSLERPETNTLSVGAHLRDGESVEAKGMPKVKQH